MLTLSFSFCTKKINRKGELVKKSFQKVSEKMRIIHGFHLMHFESTLKTDN